MVAGDADCLSGYLMAMGKEEGGREEGWRSGFCIPGEGNLFGTVCPSRTANFLEAHGAQQRAKMR